MLLNYLGLRRSKKTSSSKKPLKSIIEELCHQFSFTDLCKATNNFDDSRLLGRGLFDTKVYKGCLKHDGVSDHSIAIKRVDRKSGQMICEMMKNEIELLCQLHHPNLVSLIGFCNYKDELIIAYEYMPNGSLSKHLHPNRDMEPLLWKKRLEIGIGVAHGVHYLHTGARHTIFHRDLKPPNILLDNNMMPKLMNLTLSLQGQHSMSKPEEIVTESVGTFGYVAPEFIENGSCSDKCDVYSFGMVLLELICAHDRPTLLDKIANLSQGLELIEYEQLFDTFNPSIIVWSIFKFVQRFPAEEFIDPILKGKIAPECWEVFINITKKCLEYDPVERPAMGEVEVQLEHALALQEEADARNTASDYTLSSTTIFSSRPDSIGWKKWLSSKSNIIAAHFRERNTAGKDGKNDGNEAKSIIQSLIPDIQDGP